VPNGPGSRSVFIDQDELTDDPVRPGPPDAFDPSGPTDEGGVLEGDDPSEQGEPIDGPSPGRPSIDPRIRQRRVAIQRSQGRKRLLWLGGATGVLVLVVLVVALAHTPWFGARAISVTGTHPRTSDAAIVAAAGLQNHPPLISLNPGAVARRVEALPFIATARVHKHWPDGVQIAVTERVPVVQMAGPGSSWSLLDGHGRTLQVVPGRVPGLVVYIVHTATAGIPPAPVGGSLPPSAAPGLEVSRSLPPAFADQVVSVTVAADGSISMALTSGITVLFGSDADRTSKYKDIAAILSSGTLHATSVIDVSVPASPTVSG
jgi:cell division protein FtsQ